MLVAAAASASLWAEGAASGSSNSKAANNGITIGWAELDGSALDISDGNAGIVVPRQLMARLGFVTERWPSKSEASLAVEKESLSELEKARAAVAKARAARDLAALTVRDAHKRASELDSNAKAIAKAEAALAEALSTERVDAALDGESGAGGILPDSDDRAADASRIDTKATAPLSAWKGHESGSLLPVVSDPAATCEEEQLDVLVYGSVGKAGSFLAIRVAVYIAASAETAWSGVEYASPDGLEEAVAALARPIAEAVLGRPFSLATIIASPPTALVTLDGAAMQSETALLLEGGPRALKIEAKGFVALERELDVELGKDVSLSIALVPVEAPGFTVESEPSGATVHLDGKAIGPAPAEIAGAGFSRVIKLSMEGFEDARLIARPDAFAESVKVALIPSDGLSFDEAFDSGKDKFYRALGWFVYALPVTVVSGGLFQLYNDAATAAYELYGDSIDPDIVTRLNTGFYASQTVFWASAATVVGLTVNAALRLAAYLTEADK